MKTIYTKVSQFFIYDLFLLHNFKQQCIVIYFFRFYEIGHYTLLYLVEFYNKQVFSMYFCFKELDELPQSNLNIASNSDLTDLGTLDTGPCRPILSVSYFL